MATFRQRASGYWQAVVRRKGQETQSRSFEKKADAEKWARDVESRMDRGVFVDLKEAEAMTLASALTRYEQEVSTQKRSQDIERYRIAAWKAHKLSCKSLASLRGSDFAAYRDSRLKAGCAASTIQKELALVSHLFTTARREWGMEGLQNPLTAVRKPPVSNSRDRVFLEGEEERLLRACKNQVRSAGKFSSGAQSPFLLPAVKFALATAMRQSEIAGLLWENVDLQRQIVHLPLTKNGQSRDVPLSSAAKKILEDLLVPQTGLSTPPRGEVFQSTTNALKIGFIRAVKRARTQYLDECAESNEFANPRMLVDFHFHDLRHVATSRLAEKLPNVIELAAVTGHKDLRMLKRYYHPKAEDLARKLG